MRPDYFHRGKQKAPISGKTDIGVEDEVWGGGDIECGWGLMKNEHLLAWEV